MPKFAWVQGPDPLKSLQKPYGHMGPAWPSCAEDWRHQWFQGFAYHAYHSDHEGTSTLWTLWMCSVCLVVPSSSSSVTCRTVVGRCWKYHTVSQGYMGSEIPSQCLDNLCRKSCFSRFPSLTNRFSLILVHGSCRLPISSPDVYSKRNVFDLPCREYGILGPWNYLESLGLSQGKSTRLGWGNTFQTAIVSCSMQIDKASVREGWDTTTVGLQKQHLDSPRPSLQDVLDCQNEWSWNVAAFHETFSTLYLHWEGIALSLQVSGIRGFFNWNRAWKPPTMVFAWKSSILFGGYYRGSQNRHGKVMRLMRVFRFIMAFRTLIASISDTLLSQS